MGFTTYFFFPETAGVPVENAHAVFQDHWFWPKAYPEIKEVRTLSPAIWAKTGTATHMCLCIECWWICGCAEGLRIA